VPRGKNAGFSLWGDVRYVLAASGAAIFFGLNGVLWIVRPPGGVWLALSALLGVAFFGGMLWYVTRER
jgi:hypothetical protein